MEITSSRLDTLGAHLENVFYLTEVIASVIIGTNDFIKFLAILHEISRTHEKILVFHQAPAMKIDS
jgi:hypothetical protein